jgi:hypothetical protein
MSRFIAVCCPLSASSSSRSFCSFQTIRILDRHRIRPGSRAPETMALTSLSRQLNKTIHPVRETSSAEASSVLEAQALERSCRRRSRPCICAREALMTVDSEQMETMTTGAPEYFDCRS